MFLKPVENLRDAMRVRTLRNSCRDHLTNYTNEIGFLHQLLWFYRHYRDARKTGKYRLYLWCDDQGLLIGYGALARADDELLITECVATKYRRQGHGRLILERLVQIAREEKRDLVAEIWATNAGSVALHERAGFKLESSATKQGKQLCRYVLSAQIPLAEKESPAKRSRIVA